MSVVTYYTFEYTLMAQDYMSDTLKTWFGSNTTI